VGDGVELDNCKTLAEELNVPIIFHGRKSIEEMPKYYAMADAMLVTMKKDPIISLTLPGKVQSYMAAGKPIIGAIDGETRAIISETGCGFCCCAEDSFGLAECARAFVENRSNSFGEKGYQQYRDKFSKEAFVEKVEEEFSNACIDN
jgi:glycosyltransferase involved in cell wall biosynthesis